MTLTDASRITKKGLLYGSIFLFVVFSLWGGWSYYQATRPKPVIEEKPDLKFGVLSKPPLPKSDKNSSEYSYNLDTENGSLPQDLPKLLKVYFIPQLGATFLAPDRTKKLAADFDFTIGPDILSATQYQFTDGRGGNFIFDLNSGNFKFRRPVSTDSAELRSDKAAELIADQPKLADEFKSFLSSKGILKDQLRDARTVIIYDSTSQQTSQTASISLWQIDIDEIPIVTTTFKQGLIKGVMTKYAREQNKFTSLDYIYWQVDTQTFGTYPLISAQRAFDQLKTGGGVVIVEPPKSLVSITKIYLAYLLAEEYSAYLQPVFVFEGQDFVAYVKGIADEHLAQ